MTLFTNRIMMFIPRGQRYFCGVLLVYPLALICSLVCILPTDEILPDTTDDTNTLIYLERQHPPQVDDCYRSPLFSPSHRRSMRRRRSFLSPLALSVMLMSRGATLQTRRRALFSLLPSTETSPLNFWHTC